MMSLRLPHARQLVPFLLFLSAGPLFADSADHATSATLGGGDSIVRLSDATERGATGARLRGGAFDRIVSLEFKAQPMEEAFRIIAFKADINFIYRPQDFEGAITVSLKRVRLGAALEAILASRGLSYSMVGADGVRIVRPSEAELRPAALVTMTFLLNFAKAEDMAKTIRPMLSAQGRLEALETRNCLVVSDTPEDMRRIADTLERLDRAGAKFYGSGNESPCI